MVQCSGICVTGNQCKNKGNPFCSKHWPFECGVCLESLHRINGVKIYCGHVFCQKCLYTWIIEKHDKATCPLCRSNISHFTIQKGYQWGEKHDLIYYPTVVCHSLKELLPHQRDYIVDYFKMYKGIAVEDSVFQELLQLFLLNQENANIYEKLTETNIKLPVKKKDFLPERLHTFY